MTTTTCPLLLQLVVWHALCTASRALWAGAQLGDQVRKSAASTQRKVEEASARAGEHIPRFKSKADTQERQKSNAPPQGRPYAVSRHGTSTVWSLPTHFSEKTVFWRKMMLDVPKVCRRQRCPVLVDFHPYYSNSVEEREWMQWFTYQQDTGTPFILLTPDGSGDVVEEERKGDGQEQQGWNVLGWGERLQAMSSDSGCQGSTKKATCLDWAVHHYSCYASQVELDPGACSKTPPSSFVKLQRQLARRRLVMRFQNLVRAGWAVMRNQEVPDNEELDEDRTTSSSCATMSAQDDANFIALALRFVIDRFGADSSRIYFFGQSQGGMAALAFAVPGVLPDDLRPAAVVAVSAAAARSHTVNLEGRVQTLLMHGSRDDIVPPTVWSGVVRNMSYITALKSWQRVERFSQLKSRYVLSRGTNGTMPMKLGLTAATLWADAMTGGQTLKRHRQLIDKIAGCPNKWGEETTISLDGFLYDPFPRTLAGVAGRTVNMAKLQFRPPPNLPEKARASIQCADIADTAAPITTCIFNGGHCLPWQRWIQYDCNWTQIANGGRVFHDFVWRDFLQGGSVYRSS